MAEHLTAWLYGTPVVDLLPARDYRITLRWRDEGIARWGLNSSALSVGLPLGSATGPRDMRGLDFFENILPEGPALTQMAALAGTRPADTYGVISAFGRDCAGAIVLLPEGEEPGSTDEYEYVRLGDDGLRQLINSLDTAPLGMAPERGFRPSLAGFQRKALLGRAADGTWQLPRGGAPSTWILKPDGPHAMAANEWTCLELARACGLDVPETALLDLQGLLVLAVKRYDRRESPSGPERVHQEDGCQATAAPPALKYEEQGGPSLRDLATVLRDFGNPRDVTSLLRRTTFNVAVGNADAHAKNFSVLHPANDPIIGLAPLYDVLSTVSLELTDNAGNPMRADTHMGQRVGGERDIEKMTAAHLVKEAASWGIRRPAARKAVSDTLDRMISAIPGGAGDERVLGIIRSRAENLAAAED